jgi:hypothetical protein
MKSEMERRSDNGENNSHYDYAFNWRGRIAYYQPTTSNNNPCNASGQTRIKYYL